MKNTCKLDFNYVYYDKNNNYITDLRNEQDSILKNASEKDIKQNLEEEEIKGNINNEQSKKNNILIQNNLENSKENNKNRKVLTKENKKLSLDIKKEEVQEEDNIEEKKESLIANYEKTDYLERLKKYNIKYIDLGNKQEIAIPKYPILIGKKIIEDYYTDIYRYLFVEKHNLKVSKYPIWVSEIKPKSKRENKKKELRDKYNKYYLDEYNKLYRKIEIKNKNINKLNINAKTVEINEILYHLLYIPETLDIISYLNSLHIEDGHKGITSLRQYLVNNNIFFEGSTILTQYTVKNCLSCSGKNKNKIKREPPKQIITYFPRQRYIMDLTELPIELKENTNYKYLFNIIDHFSKFGISFLIENKESSTIFKYLKIALECNGFPNEIGSDNGKEFRNNLIDDYLKSKNINYIHGMPYNPHSQGVVERFHKTIKDGLYCLYEDDPHNFEIKQSLELIIKKYNNHIHSSTKYTPNEIFYSKDEELIKKVLENIKSSFKKTFGEQNFKDNENCLLNTKYKINKIGDDKEPGILIYDKIKKKNLYGKINVTILNKSGTNYKIKIQKDYKDLNLYKNDLYIVEYKLLSKCSEKVWNSLLKKDNEKNDLSIDDVLNADYSISEEEANYINTNKNELD